LLLMEYNGKGGLEPERRELCLFHALSPAWVKPGQRVAVTNAPTEFGKIDAAMTFDERGATVAIAARFHTPPAAYRIRVPYFKRLTGFESDAAAKRQEGDSIVVSPDTTKLTLRWEDKPDAHRGTWEDLLTEYRKADTFDGVDAAGRPIIGHHEPFLLDDEKLASPQPLSFDLVRQAFLHEYARRTAKAERTIPVRAPVMLTTAQRQAEFERQRPARDPRVQGIAVDKPTAASAVYGNYAPSLAADGNAADLQSSWQADPYPQWWQVDLGQATTINRIHVFPYWGGGRYYRYTVEVSSDGAKWTRVADKSRNTAPSTAQGDDLPIPPVETRYVRVNMLYHSLNGGVHLVEVRVFSK
jgi:hypothetical protein